MNDLVSPGIIGAAATDYLLFFLFIAYMSQFDYEWFGGYANVVGITFMYLFFGALLAWRIFGQKKNPHETPAEFRRQIARLSRIFVFVSIAATLFVVLLIVLSALELRQLQPITQSLYFQIIAVISLQAYRIDQANLEIYKEDPVVA